MTKVGEIALILNDRFAVAKTNTPLIIGSEVIVYKDFPVGENAQNATGLTSLDIPKGKLKVISMQADNTYLLSVISKNQAEATDVNQTLALSLSTFNVIFAKDENSEVSPDDGKEPADYSAKIDTTNAMNIDFNILVTYGDAIAFQYP